ncbi:hypothetical protein BHE75_01261 [Sphingomonas haloaromaticamans]|uniref:Uncharacterized protein n=1 Tax=Edaphosphingomonas haloaromaticamans TaxID=653954 RepID=A0A1S1HCH8_9SPHN|nr:hypothetical protein BHE75_01261 [Sphingomonas haloaromaticamans]
MTIVVPVLVIVPPSAISPAPVPVVEIRVSVMVTAALLPAANMPDPAAVMVLLPIVTWPFVKLMLTPSRMLLIVPLLNCTCPPLATEMAWPMLVTARPAAVIRVEALPDACRPSALVPVVVTDPPARNVTVPPSMALTPVDPVPPEVIAGADVTLMLPAGESAWNTGVALALVL